MIYCEKVNKSIVGYYVHPEFPDESSEPSETSETIASNLISCTGEKEMLILKLSDLNSIELGKKPAAVPFIYSNSNSSKVDLDLKEGDSNGKKKSFTVCFENSTVLETTSKLLGKSATDQINDFESHLEFVVLDWLQNIEFNNLVTST
ncbi:hypothetical protein AYI70_g3611 [Smittium culicis]|uniref:Uncharacterized protein n=1 Tax=Smittium culicis TaxID=133412 RepID=A0A1R1X8E7_9FUNG|nr:hypothetical protein AYI70_g10063 [Smittium culicis]OMJ21205.1 hypothetical protein AYI70_g3611 [Smittium culicis]